MTLTGTYRRNLDEKRRLAIPKRLREEFQDAALDSLYIAPGTDHSLALYSPTAFERLAQRLSESFTGRAEVQNYLRLFYSRAEKADLDSQSRVRISDRLADFAALGREVVLLGVHDHAELWDAAKWDQFLEQHNSGFDELARKAFEG